MDNKPTKKEELRARLLGIETELAVGRENAQKLEAQAKTLRTVIKAVRLQRDEVLKELFALKVEALKAKAAEAGIPV